jgi:hypothetical protein
MELEQPSERADVTTPADPSHPDAGDLIKQMVEAGEWPEPDLLERIVAAGDAAVEPLLEVLHTRPRGWPDEAPLVFASGLISELKPPGAFRELVAVARDYLNETSQEAGDALARFGPEGLDALLGLIEDPAIVGFQRAALIDCAKEAARDDTEQRARVATVLRQLFAGIIQEVNAAETFEDELLQNEPEEEHPLDEPLQDIHGEPIEELEDEDLLDHHDEKSLIDNVANEESTGESKLEARWREEAENETVTEQTLAFLASDLCSLADPLARELIDSAFEQELIDTQVIDPDDVTESYNRGPRSYRPRESWLTEYRQTYKENLEREERLAAMTPVEFPSRTSYPSFERTAPPPPRPPVQPIEPIRKSGPKIGRNDPCWCGSGKKYKKCHLGKAGPS